ncbi:MAG: amidohydrolase [Undibacterium sp.]|nr:amidohydrolase [Undibacterium sp.]
MQVIRRDIHAHPELSFEEFRTSALVAEKLQEWGITILQGLAGTGVVGVIRRGQSHRAIGLRADMDALPMQEVNEFAHTSQHPGKMHSCGHDGHTAMLLSAAHYLQKFGHFDGTVYLIFQPAEEGGGGAEVMISQGLFEKCPVDAVFGMHNWPGIPVGHFALKSGAMMASANEFALKISGKGAHAAQPQMGIDPIMVAVHIAQAWQTIVSRQINPLASAVLSITQIHAGSATNVIADEAIMVGTVRTFDGAVLDEIEKRMQSMARHTAEAYGASVDFRFTRNYPALINHEKETQLATEVLQKMVGEAQVNTKVEASMGAEDFAFMLQAKPGCYVFIGNGDGDHRSLGHGLGPCNLHNPSYDFNDALLPLGASYWVNLAESFLS